MQAEGSEKPTGHVSHEPLLRGWVGGFSCPGEISSPSTQKENGIVVDLTKKATTFGDLYDVEGNIGEGSFGVVIHVRHRASKTDCVAKVINKENAGDRYRAQLVEGGGWVCLLRMTLQHPHLNVVPYYDMLEGPTDYFVMMEHLEGLELLEKFEEDFPITEGYCQPVMRQVLAALGHIHDVVGIYHRDIKLNNFRYRTHSAKELVLVDFGLARFISKEWDGSVAGTLLYMAPEAVKAIAPAAVEGYSAPADVWAAGVIFYMMLVGSPPWDDDQIWTLGKATAEAKDLLNATLTSGCLSCATSEAMSLLQQLLEPDQRIRTRAAKALEHPWFSVSGPRVQQVLEMAPECYTHARAASQSSKILRTVSNPNIQPAKSARLTDSATGTGGYIPSAAPRQPDAPASSGCPLPSSSCPSSPKKGLVKVPLCLGPAASRGSADWV